MVLSTTSHRICVFILVVKKSCSELLAGMERNFSVRSGAPTEAFYRLTASVLTHSWVNYQFMLNECAIGPLVKG